MKHNFFRLVACLLVPVVIAADPAWATGIAPTIYSPRVVSSYNLHGSEFQMQALNARSIAPGQNSIWGGPGSFSGTRPFWKWSFSDSIKEAPPKPHKETVNEGRRRFLELTTKAGVLGIVVLLFAAVASFAQDTTQRISKFYPSASAVRTPNTPTLEEARQHKNLLPRLIDVSPELQAALNDIEAQRTRMEAMLANDKYLAFIQNDLTHSAPRLPLSAGIPVPVLTDVIARRDLQINGPIKRVESLPAHKHPIQGSFFHRVKELLALTEEELKTFFLRGGITLHSDVDVKKSLEAYRLAAIDLANADAEAFKLLEEEWQGKAWGTEFPDLKHEEEFDQKVASEGLEESWFDLALIDVELRRWEMEKRYTEKQVAEIQWRLDHYIVDDRVAANAAMIAAQSRIDTIRLDLSRMVARRNKLALHLVTYLRGADGDRSVLAKTQDYRPLIPPTQPTFLSVYRILLNYGHPPDRKIVAAFREAVKKRLPNAHIPEDPFEPASRELVLDLIWKIEGFHDAIPAARVPSDDQYKASFENGKADELLAVNETNLLRQSLASPLQATLFLDTQRLNEQIHSLKLDELGSWAFRVYGKIGLDLPIQFSYQNNKPVQVKQTEYLIKSHRELIDAVNKKLEAAQNSNDEDVAKARIVLESARNTLEEGARQSMDWLAKTPTLVRYQVPSSDGTTGSQTPVAPVQLWDQPAHEFEQRIFTLEKSALEMEKAYRRLYYLMEGRAELRQLLDEKRDAFLAQKTIPPKLVPEEKPVERKDLTLPDTTEKTPKKITKQRVITRVFDLVSLGTFLPAFAAAADYSIIHHVILAPTWANWGLSSVLFLGVFAMSHWMWHRFQEEKGRSIWIRTWVGLILAAAIAFPWGFWAGLALGVVLAAWGWQWSPDMKTSHRPGSFRDEATHLLTQPPGITRPEFFKEASLRLVQWVSGSYIVYFLGKQILGSLFQLGLRFISFQASSENLAGFQPVRWPLTYTPPQTGNLAWYNPPGPDGVLNPADSKGVRQPKYLVRWVGPKTNLKTIQNVMNDTVFIFQTTSETSAVEDEVNQALQEVQNAQTILDDVRSRGRADAVPEAESALLSAQTRLKAAFDKGPLRDEPLPTDIPIEIDRTLTPIKIGAAATAGKTMTLAYQKSSRTGVLKLTFSPEDYAALGTGMAQPGKYMRIRFKTDKYGDLIIPVAAIQNLQRAVRDTALNARERDAAKGGFKQIFRDVSILITDKMLQDKTVSHYVSAKTLQFLEELNSEEPGSLPALTPDSFEEWKDGQWEPYSETLPPNVVMADAELQGTSAATPYAAAPVQVAAIAVSSTKDQIQSLEHAQKELRDQIKSFEDNSSPEIDLEKQKIELQIRLNEGKIRALQTGLGHKQQGGQVRAETGTFIAPRALEKVEGNLWIYARDRIARRLNPWTEQQPSSNSGGIESPEPNDQTFIASWDPHALNQVQGDETVIRVRTALQTSRDINEGPWDVLFPSNSKAIQYKDVVVLKPNDTIQDLNEGGIDRKFPLERNDKGPGARDLIPLPGSLLPVKFLLPDVEVNRKTTGESRDYGWLKDFLYGAATLIIMAVGWFALSTYRLRTRKMTEARPPELLASRRDDRLKPLDVVRPRALTSRRVSELKTLQEYLRDSFLDFSRRVGGNPLGRLLKPHERFFKKFGPSITSIPDAKSHYKYWLWEQDEFKPNQRIVHFKWTAVILIVANTLLAWSAALRDVATAVNIGQPTVDILRIKVAAIYWHGFLSQLLHNPQVALDHITLTLYLFGFLAGVALAIAWIFGQLAPAGVRLLQAMWHWGNRREPLVRDFEELSREWSPDGSEVDFEEEIARLREDAHARKDKRRLKEKDPEEFLQEFQPFCDMMARRACRTLWNLAAGVNLPEGIKGYLFEKPEDLDARGLDPTGNFATEGQRVASDARLWAAILEDVARSQFTPRALIPYYERPNNNPLDLEGDQLLDGEALTKRFREIAVDSLGMPPMDKIRDIVSSRTQKPDEINSRAERIAGEYLDRARVLWAIEMLKDRPLRSFVALDAYYKLGWAMQNTGDEKADRDFDKGAVENVLKEYHKWLPSHLPVAAELRQIHARENPMFQGYRYLSGDFGVPDPDKEEDAVMNGNGARHLMNENEAAAFLTYLIHPKTKKDLMRRVGKSDEPTFEGMAIPRYTTGDWQKDLVGRLKSYIKGLARAAVLEQLKTQRLRGEQAEALADAKADQIADQKVEKFKEVLDKVSSRRYLAWATIRRLQKNATEYFKKLMISRRLKTPNRGKYDLRYLSDPAPVMDDKGRTLTYNADLKIAEVKYRNLLERAIAAAESPLLGDRDFYSDLADEINPKMAGKDAALDARMVGGRATLMAMSEPSNPFADDLGLRIPTRATKEASRIRVRSSQQAEQLLPTAGKRRPGSVLEISPEPPHFANAVNPNLTDPSLYILSAPNLYLKYAARLIFFNEVLPEGERESTLRRMGAFRAEFERELAEIRPTLERMNIRVKIYTQWDDAILNHDVPSEDDDHSYNTIVILLPNVRPPPKSMPAPTPSPINGNSAKSSRWKWPWAAAWFSPFILVGSLLFQFLSSASAATIGNTPSSGLTGVVQQAVQQATLIIPYTVQAGDSYWAIARRFLGSGTQYGQLMDMNKSLVNAYTQAGHVPHMLHPGDALNIGLTAHAPAARAIQMMGSPLSWFDQWRLHILDLQPAVLWILAAVTLMSVIVWLWKIGLLQSLARTFARLLRPPVVAGGMAAMALANGIAPGLFQPRPEPATIQVAQSIRPSPTEPGPESTQIAQKPFETVAQNFSPLPPPSPPPPATTHKTSQPSDHWIEYENARLKEAAEAHSLGSPQAMAEELRQEYLALYAQRKAEELSKKPLIPPPSPPAAPPVKNRGFGKIWSPFKKIFSGFGGLKKAGHPVAKLMNEETLPTPQFDPGMEALKKKIEDLIRSAKRDQALAQRMLGIAQRAGKPADTYQAPMEESQSWADQLRQALVEPQDVPGMPEADRFENVFGTRSLWDQVEAGTDRLASDLSAVQSEAADSALPVKGTEKMNRQQKRAALNQAQQTAQAAAVTYDIQRSPVQAKVHERLALAQHMRFLGLNKEAAQIEEEAILLARQWKLLPQGDPLFRSPQNSVHLEDSAALQTKNGPLFTQLDPLLKASEAAEKSFADIAQEAARLESDWQWKSKLAAAHGLDMLKLYPEEHAQLIAALERESDARTAMRAAGLALEAARGDSSMTLDIQETPLLTVEMPVPDDQTLKLFESNMVARTYVSQAKNTPPEPAALGKVPRRTTTGSASARRKAQTSSASSRRTLPSRQFIAPTPRQVSKVTVAAMEPPPLVAAEPTDPAALIIPSILPKVPEPRPTLAKSRKKPKIKSVSKPTTPDLGAPVVVTETRDAVSRDLWQWWLPEGSMSRIKASQTWLDEREQKENLSPQESVTRRQIMVRTIDLVAHLIDVSADDDILLRASLQLESFRLAERLQLAYAGNGPRLLDALDTLRNNPSSIHRLASDGGSRIQRASNDIENEIHRRLDALNAANQGPASSVVLRSVAAPLLLILVLPMPDWLAMPHWVTISSLVFGMAAASWLVFFPRAARRVNRWISDAA